MKKRYLYLGWVVNLLLFVLVLSAYGCGQRKNTVPCVSGGVSTTSALLDVAVDWSSSGIDVSDDVATRGTTIYAPGVHRVSFRFFVLNSDGSSGGVFERYLETDISGGTLQIPVGRYAIVAMNESSSDSYWSGSLSFEDSDSFEDFAAVLPTTSDGYSSSSASSALPLAAWSVSEFEVTSNMAAISRGEGSSGAVLSDYELSQVAILQGVSMQQRTRTMNVSVSATNLGSVQRVTASVSGLSSRVYLASGETHSDGVSHTFSLDSWSYDADGSFTRSDGVAADVSGIVSGSRLCFGHSSANSSDSDYLLSLEVYQNDGVLFDDTEQVSGVSVGSQVVGVDDGVSDYDISHSVAFAYVDGDGVIDVGGWGDGGTIELN